MPTNRETPRPHVTRLHHRPMQLQRLCNDLNDLRHVLAWMQRQQFSEKRKRRLRLLIVAAACAIGCLSIVPRINDCPSRPRRQVSDFNAYEFRGHFKFEKSDLYRVLHAMHLTAEQDQGSPLWMRVGPPGNQSMVPSDWAFMVLMKRMATGNRYRDIAAVMGGNKTELCNTFLHMLEWLHDKYTDRLRDIKFFRPHISDMVQLLDTLCFRHNGVPCPYSSLLGMVDGHLVNCNRPGGAGCVRENMRDRDMFNGKARTHGMKYQVQSAGAKKEINES